MILSFEFQINEYDNYLYYKNIKNIFILLYLHIYDILNLAFDLNLSIDIKIFLSSHHFDIKDLGEADIILGIKCLKKF